MSERTEPSADRPDDVSPELREQLWDLAYDLLDDQQSEIVEEQIRNNPAVARAYADTVLQASELAQVARLEVDALDLDRSPVGAKQPAAQASGGGPGVAAGPRHDEWNTHRGLSALVAVAVALLVMVSVYPLTWKEPDATALARRAPRMIVAGPSQVVPRKDAPFHLTLKSVDDQALGDMKVRYELRESRNSKNPSVADALALSGEVTTDSRGQAVVHVDTRDLQSEAELLFAAEGQQVRFDFHVQTPNQNRRLRQIAGSPSAEEANRPLSSRDSSRESKGLVDLDNELSRLEAMQQVARTEAMAPINMPTAPDATHTKGATYTVTSPMPAPNVSKYVAAVNGAVFYDTVSPTNHSVVADLYAFDPKGNSLAETPVLVEAERSDGKLLYQMRGETNELGAIRAYVTSRRQSPSRLKMRRADGSRELLVDAPVPVKKSQGKLDLKFDDELTPGQEAVVRFFVNGEDKTGVAQLVSPEGEVAKQRTVNGYAEVPFVPQPGQTYRGFWHGASGELLTAEFAPMPDTLLGKSIQLDVALSEDGKQASVQLASNDGDKDVRVVARQQGLIVGQKYLKATKEPQKFSLALSDNLDKLDSLENLVEKNFLPDAVAPAEPTSGLEDQAKRDKSRLEVAVYEATRELQEADVMLDRKDKRKDLPALLAQSVLTREAQPRGHDALDRPAVNSLTANTASLAEESGQTDDLDPLRSAQQIHEPLAIVDNQPQAEAAWGRLWEESTDSFERSRRFAGYLGLAGAVAILMLVMMLGTLRLGSWRVWTPAVTIGAACALVCVQWIQVGHLSRAPNQLAQRSDNAKVKNDKKDANDLGEVPQHEREEQFKTEVVDFSSVDPKEEAAPVDRMIVDDRRPDESIRLWEGPVPSVMPGEGEADGARLPMKDDALKFRNDGADPSDPSSDKAQSNESRKSGGRGAAPPAPFSVPRDRDSKHRNAEKVAGGSAGSAVDRQGQAESDEFAPRSAPKSPLGGTQSPDSEVALAPLMQRHLQNPSLPQIGLSKADQIALARDESGGLLPPLEINEIRSGISTSKSRPVPLAAAPAPPPLPEGPGDVRDSDSDSDVSDIWIADAEVHLGQPFTVSVVSPSRKLNKEVDSLAVLVLTSGSKSRDITATTTDRLGRKSRLLAMLDSETARSQAQPETAEILLRRGRHQLKEEGKSDSSGAVSDLVVLPEGYPNEINLLIAEGDQWRIEVPDGGRFSNSTLTIIPTEQAKWRDAIASQPQPPLGIHEETRWALLHSRALEDLDRSRIADPAFASQARGEITQTVARLAAYQQQSGASIGAYGWLPGAPANPQATEWGKNAVEQISSRWGLGRDQVALAPPARLSRPSPLSKPSPPLLALQTNNGENVDKALAKLGSSSRRKTFNDILLQPRTQFGGAGGMGPKEEPSRVSRNSRTRTIGNRSLVLRRNGNVAAELNVNRRSLDPLVYEWKDVPQPQDQWSLEGDTTELLIRCTLSYTTPDPPSPQIPLNIVATCPKSVQLNSSAPLRIECSALEESVQHVIVEIPLPVALQVDSKDLEQLKMDGVIDDFGIDPRGQLVRLAWQEIRAAAVLTLEIPTTPVLRGEFTAQPIRAISNERVTWGEAVKIRVE